MVETTTKTVTPEFWAECRWIDDHYDELVRNYANMWVAIVNRQVAAASTNLNELKTEVLKQTARKDIPIIYVEDGRTIYAPAYPVPSAAPVNPRSLAIFWA
jgi:hypothetical protein